MTVDASFIVVLLLVGAASYTDLVKKKIPNGLTLTALCTGLCFMLIIRGFDGFLYSLFGVGVGFLLFLVPFALRMVKGGDVKLLMAVGAWLGPADTFSIFFVTCLIGGVVALLALLVSKQSRQALHAGGQILKSAVLTGDPDEIARAERNGTSGWVPYGVVIGISTLVILSMGGLSLW